MTTLSVTDRPDDTAPDEPEINQYVSAQIDRCRLQMEAATDPSVRAAWQRVLHVFEDFLPPGVGEPDR